MKVKLKVLKKYRKLKMYGEELKTPDGRQAKKYRKEHNAELNEYGEIRKQVLEFYPSGHIPKVENLEKRIRNLESDLSVKNAEFRWTKRLVNLPMYSRRLKNISIRNKA